MLLDCRPPRRGCARRMRSRGRLSRPRHRRSRLRLRQRRDSWSRWKAVARRAAGERGPKPMSCDASARWYAAGVGLPTIAQTLNRERCPAPRPQRGRPPGWAPSSVRISDTRHLPGQCGLEQESEARSMRSGAALEAQAPRVAAAADAGAVHRVTGRCSSRGPAVRFPTKPRDPSARWPSDGPTAG